MVTAAKPTATAVTKPKVIKAKKPAADKKTPNHPSTAAMIIEAVGKLNEKSGSSLQAIKKYLTEVHKVDTEKTAHFIKKALKKAVVDGKLVQPKGTGAAGSFKLPPKDAAKPKSTTAAEKKPKTATVTKTKAALKKPASPKPTKKPVAPAPKSPAKTTKKPAAAKKGKAKITLPKVLPAASEAPAVVEKPATPVKKVEVAPAKPIPSPKKAAAPKTTKAKAPKTMKPKAPAKPKSSPTRVAPKRK